jgi:hypothetical protein
MKRVSEINEELNQIKEKKEKLLDDVRNDLENEERKTSFGLKLLKWFFPTHRVVLVGIGNVRGTVSRAEWDEVEVVVPTFLNTQLSTISKVDIQHQELLNKYVLLSLAACDPKNSKKWLRMSRFQRLQIYLRVISDRTTIYDLLLCASLLHGQSLVADNDYFNVRMIRIANNK